MALTSGGFYSYIILYEWTDNTGRIPRSTTSEIQAIQLADGYSDASIALTIPTLRLTSKTDLRPEIRIAIYRTEADGDTFYRTSSITNPIFNDVSIDQITYNDDLSDDDLIGRERLYTDGGVLDSDAPPACRLIETYRNRVWLSGIPENEQEIWYSQILVPGEQIAFSQLLTMQTDPRGGRITGLAALDDSLIIFKENALFYVSGPGPDNTGNNGFYDDPVLITTDVGCIDPNSIATISSSSIAGLVFQSAKGIMLLDRGHNISYIGADVEKYNNLTITSTTVLPDQNVIVFTTGTDIALIFDYFFNQWATWTNHTAIDSILWQGQFCFVNPNGTVSVQNKNKWTDDGAFIKLKVKTPFMNLAGLQGFQRVKQAAILGEFKGLHQLIIKVSYDFNPNFSHQYIAKPNELFSSVTWGDDTIWGNQNLWGGSYYPYHFMLPAMTRQKCQSISFSIEDSQDSSFNEGYSLSALTMEVGFKQGINKTGSANSVGSS